MRNGYVVERQKNQHAVCVVDQQQQHHQSFAHIRFNSHTYKIQVLWMLASKQNHKMNG